MQFNSYYFIFYFLPITIALYFAANKAKFYLGKIVIALASLVFYAFGRSQMIIYLALSMIINYALVLLIVKRNKKNKIILSIPIVVNVLLLLYFKYSNFILTSAYSVFGREFIPLDIILPIGISFYTFQQIAYVVSVSKGELSNTSALDYTLYILYFPKILMGPLMEPEDFITQINDSGRKKICAENIASGIKIFSLGLIKKVLLADTFEKGVSWVYGNFEMATAADCILLILFYTFEIYFDFSGYSDMAVGVSTMLNIDLPINFDSPYKAISIRDFWKRWHISLTAFFTKYIYIPLGGSRRGKLFTCLNTMIVFGISGLWHGTNWTFVLWGVLHGLFSIFDRLFNKFEEKVFLPVRWLCTFAVVGILWLLFSAGSIRQWVDILLKVLLMQNTAISDGLVNSFYIPEMQGIYNLPGLGFLSNQIRGFNMLIFILVAVIVCFIPENNFKNRNKIGVLSMLSTAALFVWGVLCLGAESTFVYFGF